MFDQISQNIQSSFRGAVDSIFNIDTILVFVMALLIAYIVSHLIAMGIIKIAKLVAHYGDTASSEEQKIHFRRLETYLSVMLALLRIGVFAVAILAAWQYSHPESSPAAFIGASTVFVLLAGATLVPMLRDLTAGSMMIVERWYNVGDFISLEPFANLNGVVERMTLRSTKIRSLNGEVIWVHNQYIQGARVTPSGVRNLAIDLFVNNLETGKNLLEETSKTLPVGPTTLAQPIKIITTQQISEKLWHITAACQTAPGREWLVEDFAVNIIKELNDKMKSKVISHGPLVRYADSEVERRFKRAVRIAKTEALTVSQKK